MARSFLSQPAQKTLWINGLQLKTTWIQFFDTQGRLRSISGIEGGDKALDLRGLQSGLYWVRLWNEEGMAVQKLLLSDDRLGMGYCCEKHLNNSPNPENTEQWPIPLLVFFINNEGTTKRRRLLQPSFCATFLLSNC
ncbi:T9SS C-terminal target domain-containing protein [Okeania hirsuta]|uniref:T9SS C-terminal target domain-containing protein n=1 Tax=Okeania hirsuta TaxID=1458930 RepID=A0A3N6R5G2_9CYAN|nr:T9SS C-terminal target domain-containing protein [Okeania hirsuta]